MKFSSRIHHFSHFAVRCHTLPRVVASGRMRLDDKKKENATQKKNPEEEEKHIEFAGVQLIFYAATTTMERKQFPENRAQIDFLSGILYIFSPVRAVENGCGLYDAGTAWRSGTVGAWRTCMSCCF